MSRPFEKIKKIRSLDEVITRGGQVISAYAENRFGESGSMSNEEFIKRIDAGYFGRSPIIAESLWQRFFENGEKVFFPSIAVRGNSVANISSILDRADVHTNIIDKADRILSGRFDLLGYRNVYVGADIDWHRDPISQKRAPLQHWKEIDRIPASEVGDRKVIWELNRHQHFFILGAAYRLTGDERYANCFVEHLSSWVSQNPPGMGINWSSSLEVAFRSMSWIWAFHLFRDSESFTPNHFMDAANYLYRHGRHIEKYLSKYFSPNTHLTGEALGLYYLGTQFPYFRRAASWRKLASEILLAEAEKQIHSDGVYFEQSTWYQKYTVDIYTHFIILRSLQPSSGGYVSDSNLEERLGKAFDYLSTVAMPDGTTPLIGDDDGGRLLPLSSAAPNDFRGSIAVGSVLFSSGEMWACAGTEIEDLFWLLGEAGINTYRSLGASVPGMASRDFGVGGQYVMRDGSGALDNYLHIDCGEVGALSGGHGHADTLSITAALNGKCILVDPGTYTYHESKEMRDLFRSTAAHNTLTVDGRSSSEPGSTFGWHSRANATAEKWISQPRFDLFEGSHDGYRRLDDPVMHRRSVLFLKGDYWVIRDEADAQRVHEYDLHFHFDAGVDVSVSEDGSFVEGDGFKLHTFGDDGFWQQRESWVSRVHGNKKNAAYCRYSAAGVGKQEFFTFLFPVIGEAPNVSEVPVDFGRAFVVRTPNFTDLFIFADNQSESTDNGIFASNFRYSWARLSDNGQLPDEMLLIRGDSLSIGGMEIFAGQPLEFAHIRRLGKELYISTNEGLWTADIG
ncbi:MAG: alginate lyase family protein [Acidobacteriota bacterium]|nr:MAG: alginate lyase family protein [Acidobacteriota bacterium]